VSELNPVDILRARLAAAELAIRDYEAWLGAALYALGVQTPFEIPDWEEQLGREPVRLYLREHEAVRKALASATMNGDDERREQ
jgi:hypothetical protein